MAKNAKARSAPLIPPRQDRLFPLSEAASYPGSATLDMVLYFPAAPGRPYRLWLLSEAQSPEIKINEKLYRPVREMIEGEWLDFGVIEDLADTIGPRGFGHIAFANMPSSAASGSCCAITAQIDKNLSGSVQDVQCRLWGLAREHAGVSSISPSITPGGGCYSTPSNPYPI